MDSTKNQHQRSRRETILNAAFEVFVAYGFRRTSMQDIADSVGISRPALYLEFNNKTDIFRALAKSVFEQNIQQVDEIFSGDQPLEGKLLKVLSISFAEFYRTIENTPHGEELLNIKTELAGDIYLDWLDDIKSAIRDGIMAEIASGGFRPTSTGLDAEEISAIVVNTMHGSKSRQTSETQLRQQAKNVVALVMAAFSSN